MRKAFYMICEENSDKITIESLRNVAKELGEVMFDEEFQVMIEGADTDGDGVIDEEDFIKMMKRTNLF